MTALMKFLMGAMMGVVMFAGSVSVVVASGMSPIAFEYSDLTPTSTVSESILILRALGEEGSLSFAVKFYGDCTDCISGEDSLVIASDDDRTQYSFSLTPGNLPSGTYREYIAFSSSPSDDGAEGIGSSIVQGVTLTLYFSVINPSDSSPSGPNGGGNSGGGISTSPSEASPFVPPPSAVPSTPAASTSLPVVSPSLDSVEPEAPQLIPSLSVGRPLNPVPQKVSQKDVVFSYDYNLDGFVDSRDVPAFFDDYFLRYCTHRCDVDNNDSVDLKDLVAFVRFLRIGVRDDVPLAFGPSLQEDTIIFYVEKGYEEGKYQFVLTSAPTQQSGDTLALNIYVDTGPSGVLATNMALRFDPTVLHFIGSSSENSVFPITQSLSSFVDSGSLHLLGVSPVSFIGTHGYVATVYFQPLRSGFAQFTLVNTDSYSESSSEISVRTKDLFGKLTLPAVAQTSLPPSSCGCFTKKSFPLCISLSISLIFVLIGFVCFLRMRYTQKKIIL